MCNLYNGIVEMMNSDTISDDKLYLHTNTVMLPIIVTHYYTYIL